MHYIILFVKCAYKVCLRRSISVSMVTCSWCSVSILFVKYNFLATDRTGSTSDPKCQADISEIMRCLLEDVPASGIQLLQDDLQLGPKELVRRPFRLDWAKELNSPLEPFLGREI